MASASEITASSGQQHRGQHAGAGESERIHKFLARRGVASRRSAEQMVLDGRVKVNGLTVREPGVRVNPSTDRVEVDGKVVPANEPPKVYIMLNKPPGYTSTVHDPHAEMTVIDLVEPEFRKHYPGRSVRLYPVGRLDLESRGLILLTNDGDFAFALTHPKGDVPKTYIVTLDKPPSSKALSRMSRGMHIKDYFDKKTRPAAVSTVEPAQPKKFADRAAKVRVTLKEGRKRQIRRMFSTLGYTVLDLERVAVGPLNLGDLPSGKWRYLTREEVRALQSAGGLRKESGESGDKRGFIDRGHAPRLH